jgi:hypothetical protein
MAARGLQGSNLLWLHNIRRMLIFISIGGYAASCIYGFQSSFGLFGGDDSFPYYAVMDYGAVIQATFGSVVFILILVHFVAAGLSQVSMAQHDRSMEMTTRHAA